MQLTVPAFKAAAKRLASANSLPLASSQEQLAKALGFTNVDAALKRLSSTTPTTPAVVRPESSERLWCNMPKRRFSVVVYCLRPTSDPGGWADKGMALLNAAMANIEHTKSKGDITGQDLFKAISMQGIEDAYIDAIKTSGSHEPDEWPIAQRALGRYLKSLPAYKVHKLLVSRGLSAAPVDEGSRVGNTEQDSMAFEQHDHRVNIISPMLDTCEAIEAAGGPQLMKWDGSDVTLDNWLSGSESSQLFLDDRRLQQIRAAIFLATDGDIYQGANRHHRSQPPGR